MAGSATRSRFRPGEPWRGENMGAGRPLVRRRAEAPHEDPTGSNHGDAVVLVPLVAGDLRLMHVVLDHPRV